MKTLPFIFSLVILILLLGCAFLGISSPEKTDTSLVTHATPITAIPTTFLTGAPFGPSPQTPDLTGVCLLYPDHGAILLKEENRLPQEISGPNYEYSDVDCPPEALLPEIEVNVADIGDPEQIELRHFVPHLCRQHPARPEIWFNTEKPMEYGKYFQSDLWRYNVEVGTVDQILPDGQGGEFFSFSPDGENIILSGSQQLRLLQSDGDNLRLWFEFPQLSICSEVNVWVIPWWNTDSSGVFVHVPPGCLNSPNSWAFGLWWIPIQGAAVSIDRFSLKFGDQSLFNSTPGRREWDSERYVSLGNGSLYLSQEGRQSIELIALEKPEQGYTAFLCPFRE